MAHGRIIKFLVVFLVCLLAGTSGEAQILQGVMGSGGSAFNPAQLGNLLLWLDPSKGTFTDTGLTTAATTQGAAVKGWADQSGNGNNATDSSGGTLQLTTNGINGRPALKFAAGNKLVTPSFLTSNQSTTIYFVTSAFSGQSVETAFTSGSDFQAWFGATTSVSPQKWSIVNPTAGKNAAPPGTPAAHVLVGRWDGTFRLTSLDNYTYLDYSTENSGFSGALTLARPASTGNYYWSALFGDIFVFNAVHTPAQMRQMCDWLQRKYGQPSLYTLPNLALEGNSWVSEYVVSGSGAEGMNLTPSDVILGLGANYNYTKVGVAGRNITTMISQAPTEIDPFVDAGGSASIIAGWEIINQCGASTASQTYSYLQAWASARKAAGWGKVIIIDALPNPNSTSETCREGVNALLAADFPNSTSHSNVHSAGAGITYADYLVQLSQDATMGYGPTANCTGSGAPWSCCTGAGTSTCANGSGANNTSYYQTDHIHPDVSGAVILAPYIEGGYQAALGQ